MKRHAGHRGDRPWTRTAAYATDPRTCAAVTVRDPEDPRWDPDLPDTYVQAVCVQRISHAGWHVAADGYAWHPDDDAQHVHLGGN